jgi:hypothetical protein
LTSFFADQLHLSWYSQRSEVKRLAIDPAFSLVVKVQCLDPGFLPPIFNAIYSCKAKISRFFILTYFCLCFLSGFKNPGEGSHTHTPTELVFTDSKSRGSRPWIFCGFKSLGFILWISFPIFHVSHKRQTKILRFLSWCTFYILLFACF